MHKFPNGKVYIGVTSQKLYKRWQHGEGYHNAKVHEAIFEYGWCNIEHVILYENLTKEDAKKLEIETITKYKSNNSEFGYNVSKGGWKPLMLSSTREKLRQANLGKKQSDETKEKRAQKLRGRKRPDTSRLMSERTGNKNPNYGKKASQKTREALLYYSQYRQFGANNPCARIILQFDKDGNFIKEFSSIIEAVNELKLKSNHVTECCQGKYKTAHGFIWKYKEVG